MTDQGWGCFTSEHLQLEDGDNRASFLRREYYNREHLLYLWHLADTLGILSNMLNVLSKDVAIDCDGEIIVSASLIQKKRKKEEDETTDDTASGDDRKQVLIYRRHTSTALNYLAISEMKDTLLKTWETATSYEIKALEAPTDRHKQIYEREQKIHEYAALKIQDDLTKMEEKMEEKMEGSSSSNNKNNEVGSSSNTEVEEEDDNDNDSN